MAADTDLLFDLNLLVKNQAFRLPQLQGTGQNNPFDFFLF